eukprot:TRINITY_DN5435_c0_g1_i1.p1 TRINITY_DN5435_c0_g1~~TRINITY_DN5435_c0_g1_i1.p1  ORF type:complete len:379 (+),score=84.83 TRINITY_DN5435_c0_g1_i1:119-1255(+)
METTSVIETAGMEAQPMKQSYPQPLETHSHQKWTNDARCFEYTSACDPPIRAVPAVGFDPARHLGSGPSEVLPFDLSADLQTPFPATSPNLMASFIRINAGERVETCAAATSQAFYVIRGAGKTTFTHPLTEEEATIEWQQGDLIALPAMVGTVQHFAAESELELDPTANAATSVGANLIPNALPCSLYWIHDQPLLEYLGVKPSLAKFSPTFYPNSTLWSCLERVKHEPGAEHRNRIGILLGNRLTDQADETNEQTGTLTLTHTLWSLLNILPAGDVQRPHRHQSIALDLAVCAPQGKVYTLMGPELDERTGMVKNPVRIDWQSGGAFVTPPGWWHSHHHDGTPGVDPPAIVLPIQDAGLHTYMRSLDIQFAPKPQA